MQEHFEDNANHQNDMIDLTHYLNLIKRNWISIFIFSVLVTGLSVLIALSLKSKYTATATLLIEAKEKQAVSIEEVVGIDPNQKEYYETQFEILRSNQIAEKVIQKLALDKNEEFNPLLSQDKSIVDTIKAYPAISALLNAAGDEDVPDPEYIRQKVLTAFKKKLEITPILKTQLVNISFTSEDPELAAKIANEVGYAYIENNLESRISATRYASSWITSRLSELRQQLADSEKALSDFLIKEKLIDDSGIESLASKQLTSLTERLAQVRDERIEIESAYKALTSGSVKDVASLSAIPAISQHPQVIDIRNAELEAQNEVNELSKRYGPKHDKMIAARAKLQSIEDQAQKVTNKLIRGIGKELQATKEQETLLVQEVNREKQDFQDLTVKKSKYDSLQREVETNREILNLFLTRQKETTATGDFDSTNARFTDEALIPQLPSAPKRKIIVAAAFFLSICIAIGFILIIDLLKNTIESVGDFEDKFGLIPIGGIPVVKSKRFRKKPIDSSIFTDENEVGFSESIRSIRTSLLVNNMNRQHRKIAVTSSLPEEGKTTVSLNLAISFAKVENVLFIDLDLRKPAVAERFGYKKYQQGVTNYLVMNTPLSECILKDETSGLSVLPAGMLTANPQELLSSGKLKALLTELDSQYDRIIIDTPPTLPVSDSLIIGQLVDSVVLVVKSNATKQNLVKRAMTKLISHQIVLEGVVVNRVSQKASSADYDYGQYYGYAES
ncbi:GumC family protein [Vibrio mangrovi]|uniref:non-specific protein-tyrosine kinase n=1 Tax=Vibrio mangrovi TaxID=474394 RepID=A0A1Y6IUM4_9VIBR|nr:polysaccharide biosynthesis tyrosine autokinase [Vibrio mangrovi]MDW6003086.1 polysaccharide biosynthesis tyrosine autokinase [Vibrio mangrovi]SMS01328.1 Tyrosine-protein kinase etk [Vibrio mangrovi]